MLTRTEQLDMALQDAAYALQCAKGTPNERRAQEGYNIALRNWCVGTPMGHKVPTTGLSIESQYHHADMED